MKKIILLLYIFQSGLLTCSKNPVDYWNTEFFDDGSFYYYEGEPITLYPSKHLVSVKFRENLSAQEAETLAARYHLSLFHDLYQGTPDFENIVRLKIPLIYKISPETLLEVVVTKYPRTAGYSNFGHHPDVIYCNKSYTTDKPGRYYSRVFLSDQLIIHSKADTSRIDILLKEYHLVDLKSSYIGQYNYVLQLTDESPKNTLELVKELYGLDFIT